VVAGTGTSWRAAQGQLGNSFSFTEARTATLVTKPILASLVGLALVVASAGTRGDELHHARGFADATTFIARHGLAESVAPTVAYTRGFAFHCLLFNLPIHTRAAVTTVTAPPLVTV
jgi:hypothetical protein